MIYQAGILEMLGLTAISLKIPGMVLGDMVLNFTFVDYILTGIAISGGASGLYDLGKNLLEILQKPREGEGIRGQCPKD
ncbi:MAG: hypothetical protein ACOWWO_11960 [Peptococcaceae bacterium]